MIKSLKTRCPYCPAGEGCELSFDVTSRAVIFNSDSAQRQACRHLVCLDGQATRWELRDTGTTRTGSDSFSWQHPELLSALEAASESPWDYLADLLYDGLKEFTPQTEYRVEPFAVAQDRPLTEAELQRREDQPAPIRKPIPSAGSKAFTCPEFGLEGRIVFASDPNEFIHELAELAARNTAWH